MGRLIVLGFVVGLLISFALSGCTAMSPKEIECLVRDGTSKPCNW